MILAVFKCAPFSTPQCARTTCVLRCVHARKSTL